MTQIVGELENGTPFLALVLEPGNLHKLRQGSPITLRIEDLFPDGIPKKLELSIFHSETPIADAGGLAGMADVVFDERSPVKKKPHCSECHSTIEQLGVQRNESQIALVFCATCGCVLGVLPLAAVSELTKEPQ